MCRRGERGATNPLLSRPLSLCYLEKPDFGMLATLQDAWIHPNLLELLKVLALMGWVDEGE